MFEYSASIGCNFDIFNHLYIDLKTKLKAYNAFIVVHNDIKKHSICVAIDNKHAKTCRAIVEESIVNFIIFDYKKLYLKRIICQHRTTNNIDKLIDALSRFESNVDRQIVISNMPPNAKEIVIDALVSFKLGALIDRWKDIATIICNNFEMLACEKSFDELLNYFKQNNTNVVNIHMDDNSIKISSEQCDSDLVFGYSNEDLQNFVTEIISISPEKIIAYSNKKQYELMMQILPEYLLTRTIRANLE